jgi:hypothetical protein
VNEEGSVSDDPRGIASGVGRGGQLKLLDDEVAVHGVAQQPAQGVEAAGVSGLKRIAAAGEDGGGGMGVACAGLRSVQVVAEVGGDDDERAGCVELGQQGGDRPLGFPS